MDAAMVQALGQYPVLLIVIYLLIREQGQKEKLLEQLCSQAQQHAADLVRLALQGLTKRDEDGERGT